METRALPAGIRLPPWAAHDWLRPVRAAWVPGPETPLLRDFAAELGRCFLSRGHGWASAPDAETGVLLTSAPFNQPLDWRRSLLFTARRRFGLQRAPLVFTLIHASPGELAAVLARLERALRRDTPDPEDYRFPGLAPRAYLTLHEQGRRGGPVLALVRLLQAQTKSIRILLLVGEDRPQEAYTFDLVGAHPRTPASLGERFYEDLMLRILTAACTQEVTAHAEEPQPIPAALWAGLSTPADMIRAGRELGRRRFFTEMVVVSNLAQVPAAHDSISSQYSEGCFATWDPVLDALVVTVTGSARPVEKDNLTRDELAVITRVRAGGVGAWVRQVEGKRPDPPSSEAVELLEMDSALPRLRLGPDWGLEAAVPAARSKLHGHRGVASYDPAVVEHAPLDPPYYHYPVSCATQAQAWAIRVAFGRSRALQDPSDPRRVVFTLLPGHGVVIVEKWVPGKAPLQAIWEAMDRGALEISSRVPQGPLAFAPDEDGRMKLVE